MIVLMAQTDDPLVQCLSHGLLQQGYAVCVCDWSQIMYDHGFSWWVPPQAEACQSYFLNGTTAVPFSDIEGMMVFPSGSLALPAAQEWQAADRDYMYKEASAAILGILHSLPCRVINLPVAGGRQRLFFYSRRSREFFKKCRLHLPLMTLANSAQRETVQSTEGQGGIRVGSLDDVQRERLAVLETEQDEWDESTIPYPVFLQAVPAGEIYHFVLVGDSILGGKVIHENFNGSFNTKVEMSDCSPDLRQACLDLSKFCGLIFSECLIVETPDGLWFCLDWNDSPKLSHWAPMVQRAVVSKLIDLLRGTSSLP
ncbi:MAG: hypothetical protein AB7P17_07020 [Nitrospirales bacterium]|nr:hypothetical protein [Nitrospirales bacterium]